MFSWMSRSLPRFFFDPELILRPSTVIYYFGPKVTIPTIKKVKFTLQMKRNKIVMFSSGTGTLDKVRICLFKENK